jgi:hypothetical protein
MFTRPSRAFSRSYFVISHDNKPLMRAIEPDGA